ncbi:MAG: nicotinamide riboside transporter PnuC [Bacteroidota bacterium]
MEILAILTNLSYILLYLLESWWCWPFAIIGSTIYFYLCRKANLKGESWLQLFYVAFALIGWLNFNPTFNHAEWGLKEHLFFLLSAIALWQLFSFILKLRKSALPQLDAFVFAFALAGTVLQVLYIESNWYYFIAVNAISIYTYWTRGMKKSIALYIVYLAMSIYGVIH